MDGMRTMGLIFNETQPPGLPVFKVEGFPVPTNFAFQ
jgi:hypothetical protein